MCVLMANGVNKIHHIKRREERKEGGRLKGTQEHDGGCEPMVR